MGRLESKLGKNLCCRMYNQQCSAGKLDVAMWFSVVFKVLPRILL
uniref:Uncharacterized protein n=1 Tax=Arundo donax TaxID=35708 RepID=A0A0A9AU14_ARUDO